MPESSMSGSVVLPIQDHRMIVDPLVSRPVFGVWECHDKGHEFWCRFDPGTCKRTGNTSCNADSFIQNGGTCP